MKTLAASPASRADGVTMVRSPISSLRPSLTASRTSSSQTNFSGSRRVPEVPRVPGVPRGGCRCRCQAAGRQELVDPAGQGVRRDRVRLRFCRCLGQRRSTGHQAPWHLRHTRPLWHRRLACGPQFVGHPLDVEQVPRRDVVGGDVAAEAAAPQRHGRIQSGRQADRAVRRRRVHADAVRGLVQPELENDGVVLRVDRHGVAHAAVLQDLLAALAAFAPVLHDVIRQNRAELLDRQREVAADALQLGDQRARARRHGDAAPSGR